MTSQTPTPVEAAQTAPRLPLPGPRAQIIADTIATVAPGDYRVPAPTEPTNVIGQVGRGRGMAMKTMAVSLMRPATMPVHPAPMGDPTATITSEQVLAVAAGMLR